MFDPKIEEFLEAKNPCTRTIYRAGLKSFAEFYQPQGTNPDFIDKLQADKDLGWRETNHIASKTIGKFVTWLRLNKGFKRKTVRVYVSGIQQLAKYFNVPFSTNDTHLPVSNPDLKKYPWSVEEAVRFYGLFDSLCIEAWEFLSFRASLIAALRYHLNIVICNRV